MKNFISLQFIAKIIVLIAFVLAVFASAYTHGEKCSKAHEKLRKTEIKKQYYQHYQLIHEKEV